MRIYHVVPLTVAHVEYGDSLYTLGVIRIHSVFVKPCFVQNSTVRGSFVRAFRGRNAKCPGKISRAWSMTVVGVNIVAANLGFDHDLGP